MENDSERPTSGPGARAPGPSRMEAASASLAQPVSTDDTPHAPGPVVGGLSRTKLWAAWNELRGDAYELDEIERRVEPNTQLGCYPDLLVVHHGTLLPYRGPVQVHPAFRERLVRFERVVIEVAKEVYGRAPRRLLHVGAYSCRPTRNRTGRLSEHALGNAIDVVGFEFARDSAREALAEGLPKVLRGPFQVSVRRHWAAPAGSPAAAVHERFLHALAARLEDRSDVFRGMIGPSRPDHSDHFHFDMSPWRYTAF